MFHSVALYHYSIIFIICTFVDFFKFIMCTISFNWFCFLLVIIWSLVCHAFDVFHHEFVFVLFLSLFCHYLMIFSIWSLFGPQFVIVWLCSWSGHVLVILLSLSDSVFCRYFVIIFILCIIWSTSCHFIVIVWCSSLSDHYLVIILGMILSLACHFLVIFCHYMILFMT